VKAVDDLMGKGGIGEEVFAQIGHSDYRPRHFEGVSSLDKQAFDERLRRASAVISHAGTGTIAMALDNGKPLLVMPRRKKYHEVVNDHQVALAIRFEALGHILVARDETELPAKIVQLRTFVPAPRMPDSDAVMYRIGSFLDQLQQRKQGGRM
jgi:UDP-N-acetylglucosamine transferase subunit ALG13